MAATGAAPTSASGGAHRSLFGHISTTLRSWRGAPASAQPQAQPPAAPAQQQQPQPTTADAADAGGPARVSTLRVTASYIEQQIAEAMREQSCCDERPLEPDALAQLVRAVCFHLQPNLSRPLRRRGRRSLAVRPDPDDAHPPNRPRYSYNIYTYTNTHTHAQPLCRCATKKRGEPLEAYVRRVSSAALAEQQGQEGKEGLEQQAAGEKRVEGVAAAIAVGIPAYSPVNGYGYGSGPSSPRVLAEGLLAASREH